MRRPYSLDQLIFLPKYSPKLNPLEQVFAKLEPTTACLSRAHRSCATSTSKIAVGRFEP
jgi:transposase